MLSPELRGAVDRVWDAFWSEGIASPLEIIEQTSYLMLLRILEDLQTANEHEAALSRKLVEKPIYTGDAQGLRWSQISGQAPQQMLATLRDRAIPWLRDSAPRELALSEHLNEARCTIPSPNLLAKVVNMLDGVWLVGSGARSDLYEYMLSKLATAGSTAQYRTPRHIIRLIVEMAQPRSDDQICDPACGTGGFLVAAADHLSRIQSVPSESIEDRLFHGFDINNAMLRISSLNLLLHDVRNPDIRYLDSLANDDVAENAGRYSLILTDPPIAGSLDDDASVKGLQVSVNTKKTELHFLASVMQRLKPNGRAAVIVSDSVLFGSSKAHIELRRLLVEQHKIEAVIKLPSGAFRPYAGVSASIIIFTKAESADKDSIWFYEVTADGWSLDNKRSPLLSQDKLGPVPTIPLSDSDRAKNNLPDVLARWENRGGSERKRSRTEPSFCVPREEVSALSYDLTLNNYRVRRINRKQPSAVEGWRLGDFAEVLAGWVASKDIDRSSNSSDVSNTLRVLHPSLLTYPLPDVRDLPIRMTSREPKHRLRQGDIVGRDLASARYWTVLSGDYDGVGAGQGLLVIRLHREVIPREYLVAYLSSPQAERDFPIYGVIPRIRRIDLANIIIPTCDGDPESIRLAALRLGEGAEEADRIQRVLRESRIRIFEGTNSADRRARLEQAADLSSLTAQNLRKQSEHYKAFQETYPYATARAVRRFKHALTLSERHEAAMQCSEALILSLGIFSLAVAAYAGRQDTDEITEWATSVRRGGASLGHWVGVIRAVGADARESGDGAAGLADATLPQKGGKGLLADLYSLVKLRNKISHGAGPRTRAELKRSLEIFERLIFDGLSGSAFLARSEWVYIDRLRWLPEAGKYDISALNLMGDHPDFESIAFSADVPLADSRLYLRTSQDMISLAPYCLLRDCTTCLAPELYYPDRLKTSTAVLKSLDRGHELEDEAVFKTLAAPD